MPDICIFLAIPEKINMDLLGFVQKRFIQWQTEICRTQYDDHDHDYVDDSKINDDGHDDEINGDDDDDDKL